MPRPTTSPITSPTRPSRKWNGVVPVAADTSLARAGEIAGGEPQAGNVGKALAKEASLKGLRGRALDLDLLGRSAQAFERRAKDRVAAWIRRPTLRQAGTLTLFPSSLCHEQRF